MNPHRADKSEGRLEAELAEIERRKKGYRLRPCVGCGKLTESRWCSNACFISEDGWDEEAWR